MSVSPHRKAQRAALWLVYACDVSSAARVHDVLAHGRNTVEEIDPALLDDWSEIEQRVRGVARERVRLDEIIQGVSPRWRLARMASIDLNILRLGAWEILFGELPPIAVIDACVDLAKEYGEEGTPAFVNGLLDQICQDHDVTMR